MSDNVIRVDFQKAAPATVKRHYTENVLKFTPRAQAAPTGRVPRAPSILATPPKRGLTSDAEVMRQRWLRLRAEDAFAWELHRRLEAHRRAILARDAAPKRPELLASRGGPFVKLLAALLAA